MADAGGATVPGSPVNRLAVLVFGLAVSLSLAFVQLLYASGPAPAAALPWYHPSGQGFGIIMAVLLSLLLAFLTRLLGDLRRQKAQLALLVAARTDELAQSRSDLLRAQAIGQVGSWAQDLTQGRLSRQSPVLWSLQTYRLFGVAEGAPVTLQVFMDRVHPDDRQLLEQRWRAALKGQRYDLTFRILVAGQTRWIHSVLDMALDANGRAVRCVGSLQDITARHNNEQQQRLGRDHLAALVEALPDAIYFKDGQGRWLITNQAGQRRFQLDGYAWQGQTDLEMAAQRPTHRDIHLACLAEDERAWNSDQAVLVQQRVVEHGGAARVFEVRTVPTFDSAGQRRGLVVIDREVTKVHQAELAMHSAVEALNDSLERTRMLLDAALDGVIGMDQQGRVTGWNQQAEVIFGYTPAQAIGQEVAELIVPPRYREAHRRGMLRYLHTGVASIIGQRVELAGMRHDGSEFPIELTLAVSNRNNVNVFSAYVRDITVRKAAEAEIQQLAFFDPLTGLPNRRLLHDRLRQALAGHARHQHQGALLFIDLDNFKTLNDTMGHIQGDKLLQQVAQRLNACVREGDTVARLGGDEFVVMLLDLSASAAEAAAQAEVVGEKLLAALRLPYSFDGVLHHSSASIGLALFDHHHDSADELLKRADLALYRAKDSGRNTLRFFDPAMQAAVTARALLEADLRLGLQTGQFVLHYQPQVDDTGALIGVEALVRWHHPQRGLVMPGSFVALAEDTGLILWLGAWVMEQACAQLTRWAAQAHTRHLSMAVNVSPVQFHRESFVEEVLALLARTGAPPSRLKLELTERLLVDDIEDVIVKMAVLKTHGVGFSLDDFGTGYSSLSYLKRLPLDQLKVDQSFLRGALTNSNDAAIASAIIALGQSLGMMVIAEGVETAEQRDFLAREGCRHYQGYFFGRPVPIDELALRLSPAPA